MVENLCPPVRCLEVKKQLNIVDLNVLSKLRAGSLLLGNPWGRTQWRKQNNCDCERDMREASGKAASHESWVVRAAYGFAHHTRTLTTQRSLVLHSSLRIFWQKRDCSQSVLNQENFACNVREQSSLYWLDCEEPFRIIIIIIIIIIIVVIIIIIIIMMMMMMVVMMMMTTTTTTTTTLGLVTWYYSSFSAWNYSNKFKCFQFVFRNRYAGFKRAWHFPYVRYSWFKN